MRGELEQQLFDEFQEMFLPPDLRGDPQLNLMCFGFECGDGWYHLIHYILQHLRELGWGHEPEEYIVQIKEKYAGLRVYVTYGTDEVEDFLWDMDFISQCICEECGLPGNLGISGTWYRTLCPRHMKEYHYTPVNYCEEY
jgi:hypothetical protein